MADDEDDHPDDLHDEIAKASEYVQERMHEALNHAWDQFVLREPLAVMFGLGERPALIDTLPEDELRRLTTAMMLATLKRALELHTDLIAGLTEVVHDGLRDLHALQERVERLGG